MIAAVSFVKSQGAFYAPAEVRELLSMTAVNKKERLTTLLEVRHSPMYRQQKYFLRK
jgi:hypothetical protein